MLHLCKGFDVDSLRPPIVDLILKGREHWDNVQKTLNNKPRRVPVTVKVLKFLKRSISETNWDPEKKLKIWLICCLMWNGSLRVHEVLSRTKETFDPLTTLCSDDIELNDYKDQGDIKSLLRLHLKSLKERRVGNG